MSHTTSIYYRDRLGFEPEGGEAHPEEAARLAGKYKPMVNNGVSSGGRRGSLRSREESLLLEGSHAGNGAGIQHGIYEENLTKFKDERDAIQKKTFTKWVNKHLKKANRNVRDLFEDLRDGHNLLSLLEVLAGEILPRERGRMRFHAIQNVETALRFLRYKEIKLVNIRGEDIVDGNPKLTLGLIWTIILHFQISDIVVGQEDVSAKEALLRWSQKTTNRYPGVKVNDFTGSWRDGLAFNAIIHRNRPDLLDWKKVEKRQVRERIESAFHVMEREYGVTRLLDPEDVDIPEPDEKSIITYVSQLYDVFPEPPPGHPLFDGDGQKKLGQYKDLSSNLQQWIKEHITLMQDRNFPNTLPEMKRLAEDSHLFRVEQVPPRLHDKERIILSFREMERYLRDSGESLDRELHPEALERNWNHLMMLYQERDQLIHEEITRLEKLQRLADKISSEAKRSDSKLDDIEAWIHDEAKRVDHLHPKDAKNNCDQIERELLRTEDVIKSMFNDVQVLRDNRYYQANELHRRVQRVHDHWVAVRHSLANKLMGPLVSNDKFPVKESTITKSTKTVIEMRVTSETTSNPNLRFLEECLEWVAGRLKQVKEADFGTDLQTVKAEYERHQKEHKVIDQFQGNVEKCREAEVRFHGEELKIYGERMTILQKAYNELLVLSNKRVSDLHTLHDFISSAHAELTWLADKEDKETNRDWADKKLSIQEVEKYYEKLMSELEQRESQFSSVQDRGESLIISQHPASQVIEAHLNAMQSKWAWLLQLTLCLETHLRHVASSKQFFEECQGAEDWMKQKEENLNHQFAVSDFKLDDGEKLLLEMQRLRDELSQYEDHVQRLIKNAQDIVPLRQRRERLRQPIEAIAICKYTSKDFVIQKDEVCVVRDNTNMQKWKVSNSSGSSGEAPGAMFLLPPPDPEAIDAAEKLKRHYDRLITLWQKKHLRMRQNMIFATIKVVKSWDFQQFLSMGYEQRSAIRRALNEDSEKLIQEGEPNDPQLKRLQREIDEVNRLFDEWERRAALEDERRNATKVFTDSVAKVETTLNEFEKTIIRVCKAPLPRDIKSLQSLAVSHREFESSLQAHEPEVNQVKNLFNSLPQKTPKDQAKMDKVLDQLDRIWSLSAYYVDRLKTIEVSISELEETNIFVTEMEMKLSSYNSMPSDMENLRKAHDDLMTLETEIQEKQSGIDLLQEDVKEVRPSVEKTRPNTTKNPDVDRIEEDVNRVSKRWNNCCMQVVERLRSCEAACELLEKYNMSYQTETNWMDELDSKLRNLEELEAARAKEAWEKHVEAVQDKFRQAGSNLESLNKWLDKVERRIAGQESLSENVDNLKSQINDLKDIKEDIDNHNRPVNNTLDIIVELVETGSDVLSSAELNQLQSEGKVLKERYDSVNDNSDKLIKRQLSALEELLKFRSEMSSFSLWMEKAYKVLEDKERQLANLNKLQGNTDGFKEFISDVMTHGADLKFLTISGQKFVDLSKEYLNSLNEFKVKLRASHSKQTESQVSEEVTRVSEAYHELLTRANFLSDRFSRVGNKSKDYNDAVERAKKWLKDVEPRVSKMVSEPIGAEPRVVEEQLIRSRALNSEIIANEKFIIDAKQAAANLLGSLDDSQMSPQEKRAIEETPFELQDRYDALATAMANRCTDLDSALVQSQGVQDALANIVGWLDSADNSLKNMNKPASLIRERLDEQIRQMKVLQSDIDSHENSIQKMYQSAQEFVQSAKNVRESKKIESKVKEVQKKFDNLLKVVQQRNAHLSEVSVSLDGFTGSVEKFDDWYNEVLDVLESKEVLQMDSEEGMRRIEEVVRRKEQKKPEFDDMMKNGKGLVSKKDVTDTGPCKETLKELEEKWRELSEVLGERQNQNRARKQSLNAYESLRDQVNQWLSRMEQKIDQLDPVGVELDIIKKQMDEIRPLNQEYTSYSKTIDKINEIGIQYDAILRGSSSMENGGSNRRTSVTPRKPSLTPSILGSRRSSAVPKFSNGSIRRESQIPAFVDQSPIQIQLSEINNRYDMLGMRLGDRESDLSKMKEEIKIHLDNLKQIQSFLEKQEKNFPRDGTPVDKKESDKQLKVIKGILDQLYENQPLLDETKVAIKDVLRKRPDAPGAEVIDGKLGDVIARWKDLQDKCKSQIDSLDDLKDFQDIYDNLNNWLNSKGRMINVLGPIASDPRLVQNQMSQIAVMREEFNEKVPQKDRFNETADTLLDRTGSNTPDGRKINEKQGHINNKWDELLNRLDERERALEALSGPTRDFLNLSNKLQDNIAKVSDDLDDIAVSKEDPEQKMKLLEGVAKDFDDQRPLLAEVSSVGEHLMGILTDPASKSEIKGKLGQVERQYNNCRKKLDKALAELENAAREGREFDESCLSAEAMLREFESLLSDKLSVSADKDILKRQIKEFEPLYQEIMSKEHEIIMILNRGRDVISKSKNAKSQQKTLDNIDRQWQKLKKNAQDRQKRLNTSMEYCKKYVSSQDKFFPWLEKAEDTLHRLKPLSFVKSELQKQEKELTSFRNDVNRHSSEYEGTVVNGSTFVDSCDEDKEIVKDELSVLKERWDALNIAISERGQSLSDLLGKLSEFNEDARDLGNSLKRVEDKSASLANAPKDAKTLETIKGLLDDLQGLDKNLGKVQREGEDLLSEADHLGSDASNINDVMNNLGDRLGSLKDQLEEQADDLQNAGAAIGDFNEKIKELNGDIGQLDDEFNKFGPIARDLDTLNRQMNEVHDFMDKLGDYRTRVEEAVEASETIISQGFVSNSRELKDQVSSLNRTLDKLSNRGESREKDINIMIEKVSAFYDLYEGVMSDIEEVSREEKSFGVIGRDIESIKSQQEDFKRFQRNAVESVGKEVEKTNRNGQGLIQSAASGVNTNVMERDLEKLNDKWNDLKQSIADRERKLDQGLLQSGKFQEALAGLLSWMDEMDEMIANQKAPSSDYKVIKAQVQEQKFVAKLLADRKGAVDSLIKMGKEIASSADPSERRRIEGEVGALEDRFTDLTKKSQDRKDLLEDAMQIAKEYHDKLGPLEKWLDKTEKKVKAMEVVPTEEDQIQRRINEHDKLHEDILGKQPSFDDLADVASALMQVVGEEDAQALAEKIEELTNRYGLLVGNSDNIHKLLKDSIAGLRSLVLTYEDLLSWMETVEKKLGSYKILSVFSEKLLGQMEELHSVTEEIVSKQKDVDDVIVQGNVLMKNIANEEALQLKDKLDSLQRKYNDLASKAADLLKNAQEMLPLVQSFHQSHSRLTEWMTGVEGIFQSLESYSLEDQELEIKRLEQDVLDNRPLLESINISGPQLCQMSPGEGARSVEELVSRDNKRFDAICEQIQRRGERIQLSKQRSNEVVADIDELLDWFREVENQIRDADPPSSEPDVIRVQLKEHKALNDDISSQKGRVRDVLSNAKKVLRESAQTSETEQVKEKMDDLKETMEIVIKLSNDRLGILEQALPLSEHFYETHNELTDWLDDIEREAMNQHMPGMRPDQIAKQQEINRSLMQSIQDHKPVLDRLNKTGGALLRLIVEDDAYRVQEFIETDNQRYNALKLSVRERQQALEDALQECSQFTDKLDGMLNALANTAEQVNNAEPVSAHPEKIKEQMEDNNAIIDDLAKKEAAFEAVKKAANDIIQKAPNKNDPAIKDIKKKLDTLNGLWNQILKGTKDRSNSLENALALAEKFWEELQQVISSIKKIQDNLNAQDPPGVEPKAIEAQKAELNTIKRDIDNTKPGVDKCRQTGRDLIGVVGDVERPELKRHIEDLDNAWQNVTSMYARREQNLIDAMEKAMEFYETLRLLGEFLQKSEKRFDDLGPIGSDIDQVKKQIDQLRKFKDEVDPYMIKVEALNRQASDLTEKASAEQARAIKEPLTGVNHRWDDINKGISERQRELEHALLRLGQFQHALNELLIWIGRTEKTLDTLKPVFGDPQVIEVELAKLKVMVNDIQAHQSSVDTLNDAGRQIIESEMGSREASNTQTKLNELNTKWNNLLGKAEDRQVELEDALREAQLFNQEIQDMLLWLNDVDSALSSSKPVGGLPETAKDQLDRFMEVFKELEATAPKVEALLGRGHDYLKKSSDGTATNLQNNLKSLKSRWENIISRANDKKIKLEIALKEATEFHEALQAFINWLTQAEKTLSNLKPVSRVLETIKGQIEEHKDFQNEVSSQRETMLSLDKKGTHLKYFSQKQDVILIKNLLVSVQHRWEKVVSKSAERTRALDYGYKEAKEFHDSWEFMCGWLDTAAASLQDMGSSANKNDPIKIKKEIERHKDFQKELSAKQPVYDSTMKSGKTLKDKAPKTDENEIKTMLTELKNKWLAVCNLSVEKQRKLEEALLFSGQFKDALKALMDWLKSMEAGLDTKTPVHGDLDTVINLVEKHKNFEEELNARSDQVESLKKTAESLLDTADPDDASRIRAQITELTGKWESIWSLSKTKTKRLEEALKTAEELHKNVNLLLEWLTHAEMKLQFSGPLPEDEDEIRKQLEDHEAFMREMSEKERDKDFTIKLAGEILEKCHPDAVSVIKHWITIIQSRWDELASWSLQRRDKLDEHLKQLKDLLALLDELMQWLMGKENTLTQLEQEPLPDDVDVIKTLIDENQEFMDSLSARQTDIDSVCKPMRARTNAAPSSRRQSKVGKPGRDSRDQSPEHDPSRRPSRVNAGDRGTPRFPDRRGSRASVGQEQSIKNPRAKALWEKWRHVWMMSWDRDRRLRDKLGYLQELEKVKNFNWDEWRKRFLKHHSNKKSRVTDLLRKLDTDVDGYLPRDEFIEGILKNKFPSSKLELSAVADKFDHGDGMIDWREFIAALRPDWEDRGPLTDTQRIDDEINRQVAQCTCRQKFKVFQVGEGKYRFGDSQKLRLVRILRSTVMVRVGGGWCALDEFLVKNDPCRAKGRTNVELREQFTLASGVSQSMTPFKTRSNASPNSSVSSQSGQRPGYSTTGPITKIKEKSERSLPMPRGSIDAGSYSEEQMSFSNRRPSGIPGSRNGSRPPSRAGSNMSLNSDESPRGGSSVRRSSSMRSGGSTLAAGRSNVRNPVGFGSSSPRKSSVSSASYTNGRTASSSSTDRTPISGRTRTPSGSTSGLIQRSGSGIASGSSSDYGGRRTSKTTTSYGADGSRIKSTTTTTSFGDSQQQQRNW